MICSIFVAEKRYRIRQHPNVATTAVIVRFGPAPVLVFYSQRVVLNALFGFVRVKMESLKKQRVKHRGV